jgi:hypothetical protein
VLTVCVTLVLAASLAVVWVRVVQTLTEPADGPKTIGQPKGLVWDDRVFTSPTQLKSYLSSRGLSYSRWLARHPTAFGAPAPVASTHTVTTTKSPKPTPHVAAPRVSNSKSSSLTTTVLTFMLLVVGLVLGGSAVLPPRFAPVAVQRLYFDPDRRMIAMAAATAILLGFGVSFYLT